MAKADDDDVAKRIDALARRRWSMPEDDLRKLTVGSGDAEVTVYAAPAAAKAFVDTLTAAGDALHAARAEADELRGRVAQLEKRAREEEEKHDRESGRHAASREADTRGGRARSAGHDGSAKLTLADVPAAMVAPFHPDQRTLASAKKDPLVALAVQASKAMQPDASELERARLLAMAYAASTGDLERFWAARTQRSAAKLKAR